MTDNFSFSFNTLIKTSKEVNSIQTSSKEEQFDTNWRNNDQIHFMNSCRSKNSTFTCAVDSFLEISFIILGSFVKNTLLKSYFYKLLHVCFEQYDALLNSDNYDNDKEKDIEEFLACIRQPVWDFLALNCPSFANRDCDAIFSEIFSSCMFDKLRIEERNMFQTSYILLSIILIVFFLIVFLWCL